MKAPHAWHRGVGNDDNRFGRSEYMIARREFSFHESEEYTQSIASIIFSHVWILSAANYFRQKQKVKGGNKEYRVTATHSPDRLASQLKLPEVVIESARQLHNMRNSIMHLIESDPRSEDILEVGFEDAYTYAKTVWVINNALLRENGIRPDKGNWRIQVGFYSLPATLHGQPKI
ncbi:hypothetical protein [Teredinibacter franksiae]|uniref:hypothetical protein n=1 Tax=Teredinibacter franksiae TaxID=2761453 RepID=UPI0016234F95|nr:hypothetical protein [Teredinibacter franksiae]